jgi:DNA glycosylase AlkZ-like
VLSQRALNRALLARQGLLERGAGGALAAVEQLVALQAQVPAHPFVALWSRLDGFAAAELDALLESRAVVRTHALRSTIHLVSARDAPALLPHGLGVTARAFKSPFTPRLAGADAAEIAAAGRELLAAAPLTRAELAAALGPRFPGAEPLACAYAVTAHVPVVQTPPRGLWGAPGEPRWALAERWLGTPVGAAPDAGGDIAAIVLRYLAAYGPAASADMRVWSGYTGLRAVLERLRPRLCSFRDERGRELFDVPGGPLPDPATPAPPRFLPEYDNALLGHDDRSRILARPWPGPGYPTGALAGNLLVDGFYRAHWRCADGALTIGGLEAAPDDPPGTRAAIVGEGERLLAFLGAADGPVRFG